MEARFVALFPRLVAMGIRPVEFWQLTLGEMEQILLAQINGQKEQLAAAATLLYNTAALIAVGFHDPKRLPPFEKAFPGLAAEPSHQQQDWHLTKERIAAYGERKQAREKGGNPW